MHACWQVGLEQGGGGEGRGGGGAKLDRFPLLGFGIPPSLFELPVGHVCLSSPDFQQAKPAVCESIMAVVLTAATMPTAQRIRNCTAVCVCHMTCTL